MALSISSEMDADPDHSGFAEGSGYERFQVFQDGTSIVDAADTDGATFAVPPARTHACRYGWPRSALAFGASSALAEPERDHWRSSQRGCGPRPVRFDHPKSADQAVG
jgi:hypothetical protein